MIENILLLLVLLFFSGFFSAAETAIAAASMPRLVAAARLDGSRSARLAVLMLRGKHRLISIMLICNNLVNIFLSAYFTYFITSLYGVGILAVATLFLSLVIIIFAEVIPKNIAVYMADKIVIALAYPLWGLQFIARPLTLCFEILNYGVMKLFRLEKDHAEEKDDELRGVIEMQEEEDATDKHEKQMLQSVLHLADNSLDSAMTHRNSVDMISADWGLKKILAAISQSPYSCLPLYQSNPDKIIGVFNVKELFKKRLSLDNLNKKQLLKLAMKPWFVPMATTLAHQLQTFRKRGEHFALVIDEYGVFMGVVTLEDIISEIIGDIEDVGKRKRDIIINKDGTVTVKGTVTVRTLNRQFGWDLPEEGVNTIAGLLLKEAKIVPEAKAGITAFGFHFVALAVERQHIKTIKIKKLKIRTPKKKFHWLAMGKDA